MVHLRIDAPVVSIGMPVLNGERYIARALDSLLSQSFTDFELIVSDNASQDGTREILSAYARKDNRIKLLFCDYNIGARANFQVVLDEARGRYFMWAAHDDSWEPEHIKNLVEELERRPQALVAMSATQRFSEIGGELDLVRHGGRMDPRNMSAFRLAMALSAGKLYHLYIYGLYHIEFLRKSFDHFPAVMGGDRLFVCQLALATAFGYVDEVTYRRQVSKEPLSKRYAKEPLGRMWSDRLARAKMVLAAGPYLARSKVIPTKRKMFIPLVVCRLGLWSLQLSLRAVALKLVRKWSRDTCSR